jgi:uncharacterized SAM-binding protein YcdF (DUF218 family)
MWTVLRKSRALRFGAVLLAATVLVGFAHVPILREIGSFLVVEDAVRPAAAIVVLGGQPPFREMEAARLFAQGWAPHVIVIRGAAWEEQQTLWKLGISAKEAWEISREVLLRLGVPASDIIVPEGRAEGTLEELKLAFKTIGPESKPIILVSSKYHTRRVRLTWSYVTQGQATAIVRAAENDPFDPLHWWTQRRFALSVVREYLGILHVYAGFPVAAGSGGQTSQIGSPTSEIAKRRNERN